MSDPLSSRIASGLQTAKAWEDPQLLKTVRDSIPFQKLLPEWYANADHRNDGVDDDALRHMFPRRVFQSSDEDGTASQSHISPYARDDDASYEGDDLLLKRLTLYFKLDVMTWVNNPCCDSCGDTNTTNCGIRRPMTTEEVQGQAGRVECKSSSQIKFLIQCDSLLNNSVHLLLHVYLSLMAHLSSSFVPSLHKTKHRSSSVQLPVMRWSPDDHIPAIQLCWQAIRDQKRTVRRVGESIWIILSCGWL